MGNNRAATAWPRPVCAHGVGSADGGGQPIQRRQHSPAGTRDVSGGAVIERADAFARDCDVAFASHHWPTWGTDQVITYLTQQTGDLTRKDAATIGASGCYWVHSQL
jgi:hypothetical protein